MDKPARVLFAIALFVLVAPHAAEAQPPAKVAPIGYLALLLASADSTRCETPAAVPAETQPQSFLGYVTRVVSGDRAYIEVGGRIEMVRYIGINTPEIQHPARGAELYREAAREANRRLVEGRWVTLVLDTQPRDRYGRLLAYVYVRDCFVNAALAYQGYAEATTYPPNLTRRDYLVGLEQGAWTAGRGLWTDREARTYYRPRRDQEDSEEEASQGLVWSGPFPPGLELTLGRVGGPTPAYAPPVQSVPAIQEGSGRGQSPVAPYRGGAPAPMRRR